MKEERQVGGENRHGSTDGRSGPASSGDSTVRGDLFATTRWTVVVAAGDRTSPDSEAALAELCRDYWYPLYAYVRRQGRTREDAEDLTQAFFERFLAGNPLAGVSADRGRFRAFLLASLKHFLANAWDHERCQKRGGGWEKLSLDWEEAADRFQHEAAGIPSPEAAYDRAWALALLERVMRRIEAECVADGKSDLFTQARGYLMLGQEAIPYAEAARSLGLEEGAVRVAVHRLRKRYRELLRDEIGRTLSDPGGVGEELRSLRTALAGG